MLSCGTCAECVYRAVFMYKRDHWGTTLESPWMCTVYITRISNTGFTLDKTLCRCLPHVTQVLRVQVGRVKMIGIHVVCIMPYL